MMRKGGGYLLTVTAFIFCSCHLVVTLPLLIALLSGSTWGAFLRENTLLVYGVAGAYFVFGLWGGIRLASKKKTGCDSCSSSSALGKSE